MKNILLIGVGRFGRHIAMHLNQLGHQVMAVDRNEERIDAVMPYVTNAQIGDSVNADFLRSLGVDVYKRQYQSSYPQFFSGQNISGQSENGMRTGTKLLFLSCRDGSVPHRSLSGGCRDVYKRQG